MFTLVILLCIGLTHTIAEDAEPPSPAHSISNQNCTHQEADCWNAGKLLSNGSCYTPLEQGPCAAVEWIRHDSSLPHVSHGACFKRDCEEGSVKVDSGNCTKLEDIVKEKCSPDNKGYINVEGKLQCGSQESWDVIFKKKANCTVDSTTHSTSEAKHDVPDSPPEPPSIPNDHTCTQKEALCWYTGQLLNNGSCYTPLEQGPCAAGEWIRHDSSLPHVSHGACFKRDCEVGSVKVDSEGCEKLDEAANKKCPSLKQGHLDAEGKLQCGPHESWEVIFRKKANCTITVTHGKEPSIREPPKKPVNDLPDHRDVPVPANPAPTAPHKSDPPSTPKTCEKNTDGTCRNGAVGVAWVSGIMVASILLLNFIAL